MSVHYKFKSGKDTHTITFDCLHISVGELKKSIMQQRKMGKSADLDLQITNAQTKEIYESDAMLIPKNTFVTVARVPVANSKKSWNKSDNNKSNDNSYPTEEKTLKNNNASIGTEDDKIKEMLNQSTKDYDPSKYARGKGPMGPLPPNYTCYRCGKPGHYIKHCPTNNIDVKRSTGIPRSFMIPAKADQKGAMITASGEYAVPIIDHDAYREVKKEKPPFFSTEIEPELPKVEIPDDLKCSLCTNLLQDAVLIPCCGNSFCDECNFGRFLDPYSSLLDSSSVTLLDVFPKQDALVQWQPILVLLQYTAETHACDNLTLYAICKDSSNRIATDCDVKHCSTHDCLNETNFLVSNNKTCQFTNTENQLGFPQLPVCIATEPASQRCPASNALSKPVSSSHSMSMLPDSIPSILYTIYTILSLSLSPLSS